MFPKVSGSCSGVGSVRYSATFASASWPECSLKIASHVHWKQFHMIVWNPSTWYL